MMDMLREAMTNPISAFCVVFMGALLYWRYSTRKENLRRKCNKIAEELSKAGLTVLPEVLRDFGVADKSGGLVKLYQLYEILDSDKDRAEFFEKTLKNMAEAALSDKEQSVALRAHIAKFDEEMKAALEGATPIK